MRRPSSHLTNSQGCCGACWALWRQPSRRWQLSDSSRSSSEESKLEMLVAMGAMIRWASKCATCIAVGVLCFFVLPNLRHPAHHPPPHTQNVYCRMRLSSIYSPLLLPQCRAPPRTSRPCCSG